MSALATISSFFHQPRIEFRPDGIYVCGQPLRPADDGHEQLASAQDLERHAGHAAASPSVPAKTMPSAERLEQMTTTGVHPLPPRERPITTLEPIDDFCGTPVPRRGPPPPLPFSALLQALDTLAPAHSAMKQRLDPRVHDVATPNGPAHNGKAEQLNRIEQTQHQVARRAEQAAEQVHEGLPPGGALLNAFGADPSRDLAMVRLQTVLSERERTEHAAASLERRLSDQAAAIAQRV